MDFVPALWAGEFCTSPIGRFTTRHITTAAAAEATAAEPAIEAAAVAAEAAAEK